MVWFGLVSFFYQHINLLESFNTKASLVEEQQWYYLTQSWWEKGVHTFLKGISPKVNVIAWLVLELAYFEAAVQYFSHYSMEITLDNYDGIFFICYVALVIWNELPFIGSD